MATYTENYNLKMPSGQDAPDVEDFNTNAEIIDTVLKAHSDNTADEYSPDETYTAGRLVINNNALWKAKQDIDVAEAWTPDHWELTTLAAELSAVNSSSYSEITFINDASVFQNENKIIKTGNVVFLSVGITLPTSLSPWVGNDVGTVPEGFWPRYAMSMSVNTRSNIWCIVTINTDGRITIQPFGTPAENATFIIQMSWSTK